MKLNSSDNVNTTLKLYLNTIAIACENGSATLRKYWTCFIMMRYENSGGCQSNLSSFEDEFWFGDVSCFAMTIYCIPSYFLSELILFNPHHFMNENLTIIWAQYKLKQIVLVDFVNYWICTLTLSVCLT